MRSQSMLPHSAPSRTCSAEAWWRRELAPVLGECVSGLSTITSLKLPQHVAACRPTPGKAPNRAG